ncbi:sigma54 specific transcriptional regulator, Fis family [Alkaliphilus metalliredigens QYMF]|uniref:Sigma54 specific transcriptional regulator, Fis family n=1 Tax=Alkaliphilus metalliredigens (strain QYMF) TaxID=293826 RepID=A6TUL7_ALKMQ|nr:sigma 54-interacting transcriptional regulator [Alkaliphilus metalliredigens]ABR49885.1 sigma54 specific transcriptional regulator, Fis family [Alkaliphilus metalliredigens QYMF]
MNNLERNLGSLTTTFNTGNEVKNVGKDIYYSTAKNFGSRLSIKDYDMLTEKMAELGIGQVRITLISDEKIIVQLYECFTCGEMEYKGEAICYFEGGILAGAISNICGQNMDAIETKCNALGDGYCEFELTPKSIKPQTNHSTAEKEDNMVNLALHSLKLTKDYNKVEHKTKNFSNMNQRLHKALKKAVEINNFNKTILDSMPNCLALIDPNGIIIKINKQYNDFLNIDSKKVENQNIKSLGWTTKYKEVLITGNAAIWQEDIEDDEYIIFESPVAEGNGILRQLIPTKSEFVKLMLDKMTFLEREMKYYKNKVKEKNNDIENIADLSVDSDCMREVIRYMKKVSKTDATTLLRGESGTGKTLFAKAIHNESHRKNNPFVSIDCTTIPENFFEAELFGYEAGAYTGANKNGKAGKLEMAHGGTVFLDEIGEIPVETQSKLLRFLQEKEFERIGGITTKKVDVRIIAATNQELETMISKGQFRKDLYYRLNVININLPPLRERLEEIPSLTNKILLDFCREVGIELKEIGEEGMKELIHYNWPGNIRELENLVKRLAINSEQKMIERSDIAREIEITTKIQPIQALEGQMNQSEKQNIIDALEKYDFNKTQTAKGLGITRQTLYNKIKRFGISS